MVFIAGRDVSMKVYCGNCKYYRSVDDACGGYSDCKYKTGKGSNYLHRYNKTIGDPETQNKNNNCEYYRRPWWKFWIKEKVYDPTDVTTSWEDKEEN